MTGAGARLIGIDDELVAMLAGKHLVGGLHDGVGQARLEPARALVGQRRRALDPDHGVHEGGERAEPGDGKVLRGAERLNPVERAGRNGLLAQRVLFDA